MRVKLSAIPPDDDDDKDEHEHEDDDDDDDGEKNWLELTGFWKRVRNTEVTFHVLQHFNSDFLGVFYLFNLIWWSVKRHLQRNSKASQRLSDDRSQRFSKLRISLKVHQTPKFFFR